MRSVFDQYSQQENQLTHALMCTLNMDRSLLRPFLEWVDCDDVPPLQQLHITEQQVPGEAVSGDEGEGAGLPDGCVYTDDGWALLIESKVQSAISLDQLRRHITTAKRYGFEQPYLLLLAVDEPPGRLPSHAAHRAWRDVYEWFRLRARNSQWAEMFTRYMEVFESRMISVNYAIRGTITMFDGLRFDADNPYTYRDGKRLIRLLGDELQGRAELREIGVDQDGSRRSAITGRSGSRVWDFLPLTIARDSDNFTDCPHLTMELATLTATAAITVPNGIRGGFRSKLNQLGEGGFFALLREIERNVSPVLRRSNSSVATIMAVQRHYRSQSSGGTEDARLEADLRTIVPGKRREAKHQPEWVQAIYWALVGKQSNIQLVVGVKFRYECPVIRSREAVDLFAQSWIAMIPLVDFVTAD